MTPAPNVQLRVGLLILTGLSLLAVAISLMGKEKRLFERRVPYRIHFGRTVGLQEGARVNLSGVVVGSVENMSFPEDIRENYIVVQIRITGAVAPRIRTDTMARIRTQGVLGDKYIELSAGQPESERLAAGGLIASVEPVDYEAILGGGGDALQNFIEVTNSLKIILASIQEGKGVLGQLLASDSSGRWAETGRNFYEASASLKNILQTVDRGDGFVGQLIANKEVGREIMQHLQVSLEQARRATESLQNTAAQIERGEGTLGTLIQDPDAGKEILASLRQASANLADITRRMREEKGLLQRLIDDSSYADRVLGNLESTTADLAQITAKIERGDGTLGALVNDPELYQETKEVLKKFKGSWLLSLYRFFSGFTSSERETQPETGEAGR